MRDIGTTAKARNLFRSLLGERDGSAVLYVTIALAVLLGMVGLAIDSGRLLTTSSHAKQAADAAAMAAASQLNGRVGAVDRATKAAMGTLTDSPLIQNVQTLGATPGNIKIVNIRFLHGLPAGDPDVPTNMSDLDPFVVDLTDMDNRDRLARFAEVTTEQVVQSNWFIRAVGAAPTSSIAAVAVGGFTQALCRRTPLAICNPFEVVDDPSTYGAPFNIAPYKDHQLLVKASGATGGGEAKWTPGNFALVDPTAIDGEDLSGKVKELNKMLAETEPEACITPRISLKQGQTQGTRNALNTRFDMYENPGFGAATAKSNPNYRPALNATKGRIHSDACTSVADPANARALPRDTFFQDGKFGNGSWNCLDYWNFNHKIPGDPTGAVYQPPADCTNPSSMSRWELYQHEVNTEDLAYPGKGIPVPTSSGGEQGHPQCHTMGPTNFGDRRIVYVAVINCLQHDIKGNSVKDIPVEAILKTFLTEPVGDEPTFDTYIEIVDVVQPGGAGGVLHDIVQLYR